MLGSRFLRARWLFLATRLSLKRNFISNSNSFLIHQINDTKYPIVRIFSSTAAPFTDETLNNQIAYRIREIIQILLAWPFKEHNLREILLNNQHVLKYALKSWKETMTFLTDYGFQPEQSLTLLCHFPEVFKIKTSDLLNQLQVFKNIGLSHEDVPKVVLSCPELLITPGSHIQNRVSNLQNIITKGDIIKEIRKRPHILIDDWNEMNKKLQYVRFRMGIEQQEMLKGNIFKYSLDHIRLRHEFLCRSGMYYTPDNRGRTRIKNPSLKCIIDTTDDVFVTKIAQLTHEEYKIFSELLKIEIARGLHNYFEDSVEDDSDSDVEYLNAEEFFEKKYSKT